MKPNTYYFTHDYSARSDEKIKRMLMRWGMAGYGAYWAIIEDLYQNGNVMLAQADRIAYELREREDMIDSILHDFQLFVFDPHPDGIGDTFGSLSVQRRLDERVSKSASARSAAHRRWDALRPQCDRNANASKSDADAYENHAIASELDADAMHTGCDRNAIKGKEKKGKEKKGKDPDQAPPEGVDPGTVVEVKKKGAGGPSPDFIDTYTHFMDSRSLPARISPADAKALKEIERYLSTLESVTTGRKTALEVWVALLDNWQHLSPWQQAQLQPRQINAQLPNMIETIKQHYNGTKSGKIDYSAQAADLANYLREKMEH